tara:strand:+ start:119 stop:1162 length:1044 start_codon:yes stop_codon:yes gene_type:complete
MIEINNRIISTSSDPYIIAEISANHCGSLENAYKLIHSAKESGADAVKLQTYTPDSMTLNCTKRDFIIKDGLWKGYNLYSLYKEACTPYEWHDKLFKYANELKITIFSSPFDADAIDFLDELNVPAFKIASFEIVDLNLIKYAASKGKPLLISTGMASEEEIDNAVRIAKDYGNGDLLLFHCVSSYPALTEESNIKLIKTMRQKYNIEVGLSDHTLSNTASIASVSMGASAIEKHFILNKNLKGPDSAFSIDPKQLSELKKSTTECWKAQGNGDFSRSKKEQKNKIFRRSLYFVNNLKCGELIGKNDIKSIRPGYGLPPKYYDQIVNKKRVLKNVFVGDRVNWDILD